MIPPFEGSQAPADPPVDIGVLPLLNAEGAGVLPPLYIALAGVRPPLSGKVERPTGTTLVEANENADPSRWNAALPP